MAGDWRDALGFLSVALAILAAIIYIAQTLRGEVRPHPLSWFLFGILSLTGYLVQRDEGARQGSWTLMAMTVICFLFVAASVARGERSFSRREWAFSVAGGAVFVVYLFTRQSQCRGGADHPRRCARLRADVRARLVAAEERQRREFCAERGQVRPLADGDGPDLVRDLILPGDAPRAQRRGRDHAGHPQARPRGGREPQRRIRCHARERRASGRIRLAAHDLDRAQSTGRSARLAMCRADTGGRWPFLRTG